MPEKSDGSIIIDTGIDLSGIDKAMQKMKDTVTSGAAQSAEEFDAMQKAIEKTVSKLDNINAQIEVQQRLLDGLRDKYEQVSKIKGADSPEALKLQKQILSAESAISSLIDKSDALSDSIQEMDQKMEDAAKGAKSIGDKSKKAGDDLEKTGDGAKKAGKGVDDFGESAKKSTEESRTLTTALGNLLADGIEKLLSGLLGLASNMQDTIRDLSKLEQNAINAGVSMSTMNEAMRNLNFITGETDSNVEALSNLLRAGFKESNLQTIVENLSGAIIQFPDTLKIESLADSLQETLATGEATGQFAEMLGRVGINVDNFEKGLAKATKTGKEQEYVLQELSRVGLSEVAQKYEEVNQAQKAYADAQYEWQAAQAQIAKQIMPVMAEALSNLTSLLEENQDTVQDVIETVSTVSNVFIILIGLLAQIPTPVYAIIAGVIVGITALTKMSKAIDTVKGVTGALGGAISPANLKMMQMTVIILSLIAAVSVLVFLFIALKDGVSGAERAVKSFNNIKPPQVPKPQQTVGRGYATGTNYATRGWHPVAERGAELVLNPSVRMFKGGETVLPFNQTRALLGLSNVGSGTTIQNLTINPSATQWAQVMDLLRQAEVAGQMRRAR